MGRHRCKGWAQSRVSSQPGGGACAALLLLEAQPPRHCSGMCMRAEAAAPHDAMSLRWEGDAMRRSNPARVRPGPVQPTCRRTCSAGHTRSRPGTCISRGGWSAPPPKTCDKSSSSAADETGPPWTQTPPAVAGTEWEQVRRGASPHARPGESCGALRARVWLAPLPPGIRLPLHRPTGAAPASRPAHLGAIPVKRQRRLVHDRCRKVVVALKLLEPRVLNARQRDVGICRGTARRLTCGAWVRLGEVAVCDPYPPPLLHSPYALPPRSCTTPTPLLHNPSPRATPAQPVRRSGSSQGFRRQRSLT